MILHRLHPFKYEINYAYRETNVWLKSLGFTECFKNETKDEAEFHWTKDGVRICLKFEYKNHSYLTKYVCLNADILQYENPFGLLSMKFAYDDCDRILHCHEQFVITARELRKHDRTTRTW